jgi:hypothetical protein
MVQHYVSTTLRRRALSKEMKIRQLEAKQITRYVSISFLFMVDALFFCVHVHYFLFENMYSLLVEREIHRKMKISYLYHVVQYSGLAK